VISFHVPNLSRVHRQETVGVLMDADVLARLHPQIHQVLVSMHNARQPKA